MTCIFFGLGILTGAALTGMEIKGWRFWAILAICAVMVAAGYLAVRL
jgi:predicted MFS family arabinose efflux permease